MKNSNTTLQDIARMAEVSKTTVSMVINGSRKVHPKTSAKIWSIIQAFGYQPSERVRKLAQKRWEISAPGFLPGGSSSPESRRPRESQVRE